MKALKTTIALLAALALMVPAASALLLQTGGKVEGGGFNRVPGDGPGKSKDTKESLTINGFEEEGNGGTGTVNHWTHTPGSGKPARHIVSLDCVSVSQNQAGDVRTASASGVLGGDRYYIRIVDRDGARDQFGFRQASAVEATMQAARLLLFPCGVDGMTLKDLHGGNYTVTVPAS